MCFLAHSLFPQTLSVGDIDMSASTTKEYLYNWKRCLHAFSSNGISCFLEPEGLKFCYNAPMFDPLL